MIIFSHEELRHLMRRYVMSTDRIMNVMYPIMKSLKSNQKYLNMLVILSIMGVTISGLWFRSETLPKPIMQYFKKGAQVTSFTAISEMADLEGMPRWKTVLLREDTDKWDLVIQDGGIEQSHWIGVGNTMYVKDYADDRFWQINVPEKLLFLSQIDFRKFIQRAMNRMGKIAVIDKGNMEFEILDPDYDNVRESIKHTIWLNEKTGLIAKERYFSDTGTAVTYYSNLGSTRVNIPVAIKRSETNADPWLLSNSITATYSAEMKLKGLPVVWPFSKL